MNEDRRERFYAFLAEILRNDEGLTDVKAVTGYDENSYEEGCCQTCSYTVHEVDVYYVDYDGNAQSYNLSGRLSDWL